MGLREFVVRRVFNSIFLILGSIAFNFFIFRLMPGDPVAILISGQIAGQQDMTAAIRALWGLDQPLYVQFVQYFINMLTLNFDLSFTEGFRPVIMSIAARLPNTLLLMGTAAIVTIIIGIITGITAAAKRGGKTDMGLVVGALTFYSIPTFWLGMMFILIFGFYIPLFPMSGTVARPIPEDPLAYALSVGHH